MTYLELANKILQMSTEQQNSDVTFVDLDSQEATADVVLSFVESSDSEDFGLDNGHPFLYN